MEILAPLEIAFSIVFLIVFCFWVMMVVRLVFIMPKILQELKNIRATEDALRMEIWKLRKDISNAQ